MMPFHVICLNDSSRPESIPTSKWVKKGQQYTVVQVDRMHVQGGTLGYKLYEINIDEYFPYQYFGAWRFGVLVSEDADEEETEEILDNIFEEALKEQVDFKEHASYNNKWKNNKTYSMDSLSKKMVNL
jgi:hypothetical protein